jgi:hypothetical protein
MSFPLVKTMKLHRGIDAPADDLAARAVYMLQQRRRLRTSLRGSVR